jgi:hypothetical protein
MLIINVQTTVGAEYSTARGKLYIRNEASDKKGCIPLM